MNMPAIKLFLADVDGTLVTKEKVLTERAQQRVRDLRKAGIAFAITSGRPPKGMEMLIKPLAIDTPIAGFNGGQWVNPDLSIIEGHTLPREIADKTVKMLTDHGLDVWVYSGPDWLIHKADAPHVAREEWTVKFPPKVVQDFGNALNEAVKIVGCSDDLDKMQDVAKKVQEALGDSASAALSQPYYLDVTHPQANKGGVVAYLSKHLNIPPEQIATIGDQPNDVLMFRKSGLSIAMGNASEQVQKQATHVTESSEAEGFAIAIERYILETANG
jgi:Cof subfamily protein (haloacid dehalogenase superfamily)